MTYRYKASMYYIVSLLGLPTVQFWSLPACGLWEGPALYSNNSFAKYLLFWYHHHLLFFSAFKIDEILSELQGANLHLSIHVHQIPEETVDGNTDSKTESKQDVGSWIALQDSAPTCSKLLEPLVESGLVVMEDTQKRKC